MIDTFKEDTNNSLKEPQENTIKPVKTFQEKTGYVNTQLLHKDRLSKQKINETNWCYKPNGYRTFHQKAKEYTFSAFHRMFFKIDHIIWHKASLYRYKKIEITPFIQSDHQGLRLDFNNRNKHKKPAHMEKKQLYGQW